MGQGRVDLRLGNYRAGNSGHFLITQAHVDVFESFLSSGNKIPSQSLARRLEKLIDEKVEKIRKEAVERLLKELPRIMNAGERHGERGADLVTVKTVAGMPFFSVKGGYKGMDGSKAAVELIKEVNKQVRAAVVGVTEASIKDGETKIHGVTVQAISELNREMDGPNGLRKLVAVFKLIEGKTIYAAPGVDPLGRVRQRMTAASHQMAELGYLDSSVTTPDTHPRDGKKPYVKYTNTYSELRRQVEAYGDAASEKYVEGMKQVTGQKLVERVGRMMDALESLGERGIFNYQKMNPLEGKIRELLDVIHKHYEGDLPPSVRSALAAFDATSRGMHVYFDKDDYRRAVFLTGKYRGLSVHDPKVPINYVMSVAESGNAGASSTRKYVRAVGEILPPKGSNRPPVKVIVFISNGRVASVSFPKTKTVKKDGKWVTVETWNDSVRIPMYVVRRELKKNGTRLSFNKKLLDPRYRYLESEYDELPPNFGERLIEAAKKYLATPAGKRREAAYLERLRQKDREETQPATPDVERLKDLDTRRSGKFSGGREDADHRRQEAAGGTPRMAELNTKNLLEETQIRDKNSSAARKALIMARLKQYAAAPEEVMEDFIRTPTATAYKAFAFSGGADKIEEPDVLDYYVLMYLHAVARSKDLGNSSSAPGVSLQNRLRAAVWKTLARNDPTWRPNKEDWYDPSTSTGWQLAYQAIEQRILNLEVLRTRNNKGDADGEEPTRVSESASAEQIGKFHQEVLAIRDQIDRVLDPRNATNRVTQWEVEEESWRHSTAIDLVDELHDELHAQVQRFALENSLSGEDLKIPGVAIETERHFDSWEEALGDPRGREIFRDYLHSYEDAEGPAWSERTDTSTEELNRHDQGLWEQGQESNRPGERLPNAGDISFVEDYGQTHETQAESGIHFAEDREGYADFVERGEQRLEANTPAIEKEQPFEGLHRPNPPAKNNPNP